MAKDKRSDSYGFRNRSPYYEKFVGETCADSLGISKLGTRINVHFEQVLNGANLLITGNDINVVFWSESLTADNYVGYRVSTADGQKR